MKWTPARIYREAKAWGLALIGAGALTAGAATFIEAPISAKDQCDVAAKIETRYAGQTNLTSEQKRLYVDAVRELDECMK